MRLSFMLLTALLICLFLSCCGHYVVKTHKQPVTEVNEGCNPAIIRKPPPDSISEKVGEILMEDIGYSYYCTEEETMNYLKNEACSLKAQVIMIHDVKRPDVSSYCYRCSAVFYREKEQADTFQTKKFYSLEKIRKRDMCDRKKHFQRTLALIYSARYWFRFFTKA